MAITVGNSNTATGDSVTSLSASVTVAADDTCILMLPVGYNASAGHFPLTGDSGTDTGVFTVQTTGQNDNYGTDNGQWGGALTLFDDHANWPGTGSTSFTVNFNSSVSGARLLVIALKGTDAVTASVWDDGAASGTAVDVSITSNSDDMVLYGLPNFDNLPSFTEDDAGAVEIATVSVGGVDARWHREPGDTTSHNIGGDFGASVDWGMIAISMAAAATAGGPRNPLGHALKGPFGGPIG